MSTIEKLSVLMADANVMFTKLHNYHWHVQGAAFFQLHAKTESYYNAFAAVYDDVAERILQLGGTPLVTLTDILATTTIKEESQTSFDVPYILHTIIGDFQEIQNRFRNLSADEETDDITRQYADEQIAFLEKEIWMLRASL